jgi:hypothetical protein
MGPECEIAQSEVLETSDIFSLGIIAFTYEGIR